MWPSTPQHAYKIDPVDRFKKTHARLAWSCSFSGPGPAAALPSALFPSRSASQSAAVSLRREAPHPILLTLRRVGLDQLQQLVGKRRTISQIVAPPLIDGSYPIPSSHWS